MMLRQLYLRPATAASRHFHSAPTLQSPGSLTSRFLTTESTSAKQNSTPPSASVHGESVPLPSSDLSKPKQLTYLVERTPSKRLPVYADTRGGTRKRTLIRKVVGNSQDMKKDIIEELKFKKDDVNVNPVTLNLAVKGHNTEKIRNWLESKGF